MLKKKKILISLVILLIMMITMVGSVSAAPSEWSGSFRQISKNYGARYLEVRAAQNICRYNAHLGTIPDGIFGNNTDADVRTFQSRNGLTSDGIVGPLTWQVMRNKLEHYQFGKYKIKDNFINDTFFRHLYAADESWQTKCWLNNEYSWKTVKY